MIQIVPHRQRSDTTGLVNKENVPPEPGIMFVECDEAPIQKASKATQSLATLVKGKWTSEDLEKAMEGCKFFKVYQNLITASPFSIFFT
jgi:hypothetical protein